MAAKTKRRTTVEISPELRHRLKVRAAEKEITVCAAVNEAVSAWLKGGAK